MLLKINHETRYNYDKPVQYGLQQLRLRPKERPGQRILDWNCPSKINIAIMLI